MKYLSLFSGIGGFEIGISNVYPDAICVGFSEVDKHAIQVYTHHFPEHENLGDIIGVTEEQVKKLVKKHDGIDLVVGGFPCQNLSSLARCFKYTNSDGLEGPKSSLFYSMIQVIKWIQKYNPVDLHLLAENNASMSNANKKLITDTFEGIFKKVWMTKLNGADFGVQTRRRMYWTTFEVSVDNIVCSQTWDDVLEPMEKCMSECVSEKAISSANKEYKMKNTDKKIICEHVVGATDVYVFKIYIDMEYITRWQISPRADTLKFKSCTFLRGRRLDNYLIDRRVSGNKETFIVRQFLPVEVERLFWIPDGWVSTLCSKTRCTFLLGNTVVVKVIEHILNYFAINTGWR